MNSTYRRQWWKGVDRRPAGPRAQHRWPVFALLGVAWLGLWAGVSAAQTLKLATISPDGTSWMKAMRAGAETVERRTDGRVKLRFYPGGVMGSDKDVLRKMRVGQLHGAAVAIGSLAEVYSDAQIYQVPFAFRSYDEVDYVRARMDGLIDAGLHERGLVSFGLSEGGFAYFFSRDPIRRVADLRMHKVWGPLGDAMSSIALDTVGVTPVPLTLPDVLTGLQTGVVDTVAIPPIGAIALQWHTRLRAMTDVPVMYTYGTLVLDRRTFERLAPADREALEAVLTGVFRKISTANRREDQEARAALEAQGIDLIAPVPEEVPRFREIATEIVQRLQARGIIGADMLGHLQRHLQEFRKGAGG